MHMLSIKKIFETFNQQNKKHFEVKTDATVSRQLRLSKSLNQKTLKCGTILYRPVGREIRAQFHKLGQLQRCDLERAHKQHEIALFLFV